MAVPTKLEDWTFEVVRDLVAQGVFENDRFDFKEALPHSKDEDSKKRLRKTVAAFANTDGGFLVFGVKDDRDLSAKKRIVGFKQTYELPRDFGNYPGTCEPSVEWESLNPPIAIPKTKKVIHVVRIRPSWRKPHAVRDGVQFVFPKRTNKGNEDMSYTEVRQAFQETEFRRTRLALLMSELENMKIIADSVSKFVPANSDDGHAVSRSWTVRYDTMLLNVTLGDVFSFLSADPEIWKAMSEIRKAAIGSNSVCEAYTNVVFQGDPVSRKSATYQLYSLMHEHAGTIERNVVFARERLRKLMA